MWEEHQSETWKKEWKNEKKNQRTKQPMVMSYTMKYKMTLNRQTSPTILDTLIKSSCVLQKRQKTRAGGEQESDYNNCVFYSK